MALRAAGDFYHSGGSPVVGEYWSHSDAAGRLELDLPPEAVLIAISEQGYPTEQLGPWEPAEVPREVVVRLHPYPHVRGRVLAYGEPVEGARLSLGYVTPEFVTLQAGFPVRFLRRDGLATTDAEGRFACPIERDKRNYVIMAQLPGWARGELHVIQEDATPPQDCVVELTHGGVITGHVQPPAGRSPKGLVVAASCGDGRPLVTRCDEQGVYRLEGIKPGSWEVRALLEEPSGEVMSVAQREEDKQFRWNAEVIDGETTTVDLDGRGLIDCQLYGRLTLSGAPAEGFTVAMLPDRLDRYTNDRPAVPLDAAGRFVLPLPSGEHRITVRGTLPTGQRIELVRELELEGERVDWSEDVPLGWVDVEVPPGEGELRLNLGHSYWEDTVSVYVRPDDEGRVRAPAPIGPVLLQRHQLFDGGMVWATVNKTEAKPR